MQYLLFIRANPTAAAEMPPEEMQRIGAAVGEFDAKISESGQNLGSIRLQPAETGVTLATENDAVVRTDGPFAGTKEQIGGIYIIEADDRDEAEDIARGLATLKFSTIEVRPVLGIDLRGKVFEMHDAE